MPTEAAIQAAIVAALTADGVYVVRVARASRVGVADLLCCAAGRFLALEVKAPGAGLRPAQVYEAGRVTAAGGVAAVVRSVAEARAAIREHTTRCRGVPRQLPQVSPQHWRQRE